MCPDSSRSGPPSDLSKWVWTASAVAAAKISLIWWFKMRQIDERIRMGVPPHTHTESFQSVPWKFLNIGIEDHMIKVTGLEGWLQVTALKW